MPSVKLSPLFNDAQLNDNGELLSGGKVYWYIAGTTTPATTYADSAGGTPNTNPVILNVRGEPSQPMWLTSGQTYKATLTDSLDNVIRQIDNISGINDTSVPIISEWVLYSGAATFINTTEFSVVGDQRTTFTKNRRVRVNVAGIDLYGTIDIDPTFGAGITTVKLVLDSGVLDSSLNTVYYGFLDPTHPSLLITEFDTQTLVTQTYTAFTTAGSSGVFTLTPTTPIVSYVAGQRYRVKFHANGNGTDTINVSGLGAKFLKQYNSAGAKAAPTIFINQLTDIEYDSTDFVIRDPITPPIGKQIAQVQYFQTGAVATGTTKIPLDDTIPQITEGDQYMSLSITPQNAASTLEINIVLNGNENADTSDLITVALFKDSVANAIAATSTPCSGLGWGPTNLVFTHRISAGSTSEQTFTVRAGLNTASTFVFNGGDGTGRKFGGVLASSIKITEYLP